MRTVGFPSFTYTCAVNVYGSSDKTVNGVTFHAQTGTSGPGWQIEQGFGSTNNSENSSVNGQIGQILNNRMCYGSANQRLQTYRSHSRPDLPLSYFAAQQWSPDESNLSCSAHPENPTPNRQCLRFPCSGWDSHRVFLPNFHEVTFSFQLSPFRVFKP